MKKVSLAEVAKSLGVSKTLVSFVLNDKGDEKGISKETQQKVFEKVKELDYKPNQFARGLRGGKSNTIGLVVSDISNPFYAKLCRSIEDSLSKHDYNLMICSSDENINKESELIQMLTDRQVDGLIISTSQNKYGYFSELKKKNIPFVLIDRYIPRSNTSYVIVDNMNGAKDAVEHLIKLGNRKPGLLTISPSHISTIKERTQGYKEALKKHNIKVDNKLIREIPFDKLEENVYNEIKFLLKPPQSINALFTINNNIAKACIESLRKMKMKIPQDIALVSFDDIEAFSLCYPPVTAVSQPIEEMGVKATEILIDKIDNKGKDDAAVQIVLPTELIVRRSCGKFIDNL